MLLRHHKAIIQKLLGLCSNGKTIGGVQALRVFKPPYSRKYVTSVSGRDLRRFHSAGVYPLTRVIVRLAATFAGRRPTRSQSPGRLGIATALNDLVEDIAILIDRSPEPMFPGADGNHNLVQVSDTVSETHISAQSVRVCRAELAAASMDRSVRQGDTTLPAYDSVR